MTADAIHKEPSGAQKMFGDFAPALFALTDAVRLRQASPRAMSAMAVAEQVFRGSAD